MKCIFSVLTVLAIYTTTAANANSGGAWELIDKRDGIEAYSKSIPGSPLVAVRGETILDANIAKVVSVIRDISNRQKWVDYLKEGRILQDVDLDERIEYVLMDGIGPVSPRDFVYRVHLTMDKENKSVTITSESTDHPNAPLLDSNIRAFIKSTTYLQSTADGKTRIAVEAQADPKGLIPNWIINMVQRRSPFRTLQQLRERVNNVSDEIVEPRFLGMLKSPNQGTNVQQVTDTKFQN